jgi:hypothetical protein
VGRKPIAEKVAAQLAEIHRMPVCEDCEVLRGANLYAKKRFGHKYAAMFDENLSRIITTHVDLGCKDCPVDDVMKSLRKDRLAAIAAMF